MNNILQRFKANLFRHPTMTLFSSFLALGFFALIVAVGFSGVRASVDTQQQVAASAGGARDSVEKVRTDSPRSRILAELQEKRSEDAKRGEAFADVDIRAQAAIVYDINSGEVLYEKNAREAEPLASITKVMTVITAKELLSDEQEVEVSPQALATPGESGLRPYEKWRFSDIVDLALITSSNDAAAAIAETAGAMIEPDRPMEAFVERMNERAREIGMVNARFENPTGLDKNNETVPGAVASALDVARLFAFTLEEYPQAITHSRFEHFDFVSLNGRRWSVENTNEIIDALPGLLASKTGYTRQAGGNLAVVVDVGVLKPVVIVALGSTVDGRFSDVETLYNHVREYID